MEKIVTIIPTCMRLVAFIYTLKKNRIDGFFLLGINGKVLRLGCMPFFYNVRKKI